MPENTTIEVIDASDLLRMGYADDAMLLEDASLCTVCSVTCSSTSVVKQFD